MNDWTKPVPLTLVSASLFLLFGCAERPPSTAVKPVSAVGPAAVASLPEVASPPVISAGAPHPLDPLSIDEMTVLKPILDELKQTALLTPETYFSWVQIKEPAKDVVNGWQPGTEFTRTALVHAVLPEAKKCVVVEVDLRTKKAVVVNDGGDVQPFIAGSEFTIANDIIDASAEMKAALAKRGYVIEGKISEKLYLDPYAPGRDQSVDGKSVRAMRVLFADPLQQTNVYGPYLEGLMAIVDLYSKQVIKIVDVDHPLGLRPPTHEIFKRKALGAALTHGKPLAVAVQPSDVTLVGNHITWNDWDLRYSFNQREGLVLHQISRKEDKALRSVCYRASISEMLVPYTETSESWLWREFFDQGEYGLGASAIDVRPGKEIPDNAQVMSFNVPGEDGAFSEAVPGRVFLYERDGGTLLLHRQWTDGNRLYARSKQLVIGFISTLGNYDYIFQWVFSPDGSFKFETELHGLILNKTVAADTCSVCVKARDGGPGSTYIPEGDEQFGTLVAPGVLGVNHQHFINLRMDFDIDGSMNAVKECNTQPLPMDAKTNPQGRAFMPTHYVFANEKEAARDISMASNRTWVVYNPEKLSAIGHPAGYEIEPGANTVSMMPESRSSENVSFTRHHFWATAFKPTELHAAGTYPNQAPVESSDHLAGYQGDSQSIYKQDVVVWYSLGFNHVTKPEDYPIMPAGHVSVKFAPKAFFNRSPALGYATLEEPEKE